jgi:hypothetical protein
MESGYLNSVPTAGLPSSDGDRRHSRSRDPAAGVHLQMTWRLPRHADSIPTARRLLDAILTLLCVADGCRYEVAVMLSEACANAVSHADGHEYGVHVDLDHDRCVIEVRRPRTGRAGLSGREHAAHRPHIVGTAAGLLPGFGHPGRSTTWEKRPSSFS